MTVDMKGRSTLADGLAVTSVGTRLGCATAWVSCSAALADGTKPHHPLACLGMHRPACSFLWPTTTDRARQHHACAGVYLLSAPVQFGRCSVAARAPELPVHGLCPRLSRLPPGPRAFRLGAQHVDEMLLVDEKSIALAVLRLLVSGPCSQYSHGFSIR